MHEPCIRSAPWILIGDETSLTSLQTKWLSTKMGSRTGRPIFILWWPVFFVQRTSSWQENLSVSLYLQSFKIYICFRQVLLSVLKPTARLSAYKIIAAELRSVSALKDMIMTYVNIQCKQASSISQVGELAHIRHNTLDGTVMNAKNIRIQKQDRFFWKSLAVDMKILLDSRWPSCDSNLVPTVRHRWTSIQESASAELSAKILRWLRIIHVHSLLTTVVDILRRSFYLLVKEESTNRKS